MLPVDSKLPLMQGRPAHGKGGGEGEGGEVWVDIDLHGDGDLVGALVGGAEEPP